MKIMNRPLYWISSLYFMQGMPYALVIFISVLLFKQYQLSNAQIACYTSLYMIPWALKFISAPFLEQMASKRYLTIVSEFGLAFVGALIALAILFQWWKVTALLFFMMDLLASWHDICSDGFYLVSLSSVQQVHYVAWRTLTFQLARLLSQGFFVLVVSSLLKYFYANSAWAIGFISISLLMFFIATYHCYTLPKIGEFEIQMCENISLKSALHIFKKFFQKENILGFIVFLLIYNLAEAQLIKIVPLFLFDKQSLGGLGLTLHQIGLIYATLGFIAMILGVVLSGVFINLFGNQRALFLFAPLLLLSQFGYIIISFGHATSQAVLISIILFNQLCFGLSNNAYMTALLEGVGTDKYRMSFYAIATGLMALSMFIPGVLSGFIQENLGYRNFFVWMVILQGAVSGYLLYEYFLNENQRTQFSLK